MTLAKVVNWRVHVEVTVPIDHHGWTFEHGDDSLTIGRDGSFTLKFNVEADSKDGAVKQALAIVHQRFPDSAGQATVVRCWSPTESRSYLKKRMPRGL